MIERAEPVALGSYRAELGESPLWDAATGRLLWLDILRSRLLSTDPATGATDVTELGRRASAIAFDDEGGLVAAAGREIVGLGSGTILAALPENAAGRFNDGKPDAEGRFWVGTADPEGEPRGAFYRFSAPGLKAAVEGVRMSNGIGWSPEGRTMYYVDTGARRLDAFDFAMADGILGQRRTLVEFPAAHLPDGLTVDADGRIWLAVWGSSSVFVIAPSGKIERRIVLPTSRVSSCTFGGAQLRTLFVTTAQEGATPEELAADPLAGALFAFEPGVEGLPPDTVRL
jgi:sugar lactone lactonase YvrE